MTLSPDGAAMVTADEAGTVQRWSLADLAHPSSVGDPLPGSGGAFPAPALSVDGRLLAVGDPDGTAVVYGLPQGAVRVGGSTPDGSDPLSGLAFTADGRTLVVAHQNGRITEWDTAAGAPTADFRQPSSSAGGGLAGLAMHPGGGVYATGGSTGDVLLWTVPDRAQPLPRGPGVIQPGASLDSVAFAGHTLVTVADDTVRGWDLADLDHPRSIADPLTVPDHRLHAVAVGGGRIAVSSASPSEGRVAVAELPGNGRPRVLGVTPSPTRTARSPRLRCVRTESCWLPGAAAPPCRCGTWPIPRTRSPWAPRSAGTPG
jgi:hypothetical protein